MPAAPGTLPCLAYKDKPIWCCTEALKSAGHRSVYSGKGAHLSGPAGWGGALASGRAARDALFGGPRLQRCHAGGVHFFFLLLFCLLLFCLLLHSLLCTLRSTRTMQSGIGGRASSAVAHFARCAAYKVQCSLGPEKGSRSLWPSLNAARGLNGASGCIHTVTKNLLVGLLAEMAVQCSPMRIVRVAPLHD